MSTQFATVSFDPKQEDEIVVGFAEALKKENNRFCAIKFGAYIQNIPSTMPLLHDLDNTSNHFHARGVK